MKTRPSGAKKKSKATKPQPVRGKARSVSNSASPRPSYPFTAIVGQYEMMLALMLNVIDPNIGGVLIMGHRGTGKSTAVRALADLLPNISTVADCAYHCDPGDAQNLCIECTTRLANGEKLRRVSVRVPVVDLPLNATEDRVCGAIDIERALQKGEKRFEPGLLAKANRGFLYIDEVNLLEDHLVDLLLDVCVTGVNRVERENISIEHPARFMLIGSGNPEEGELRPQLLDRFGLYVEVQTESEPDRRVEIVERRDAFERNAESFSRNFAEDQERQKHMILRAQKIAALRLNVRNQLLRKIAELCSELNVDGHRSELTIMRAARALAALHGRRAVIVEDIRRVTTMAVQHRLRRDALDEAPSAAIIETALRKVFSPPGGYQDDHDDDRGGGLRVVRQVTDPDGETGSDPKLRASLPPAEKEVQSQLDFEDRNLFNPVGRRAGTKRGKSKRVFDPRRGRYSGIQKQSGAGARVALDATLRALALQRSQQVSKGVLRYKRFARKGGTLFIFAIDASGSMALNRINQARRVILGMLRQSYINRDRVAIISFSGTVAETVLPPSRSMLRARRALDSIAIGGGTPLSAGLVSVLKLAKLERREENRIVMLLFTDGRANVPAGIVEGAAVLSKHELIDREEELLGSNFRKAGVRSIVVGTQHRFRESIAAREVAERLNARYIPLKANP